MKNTMKTTTPSKQKVDTPQEETQLTLLQQKLNPGLCSVHPDKPFQFGEKAYLLPRGDVVFQQYVDQWLHLARSTGDFQAIVDKSRKIPLAALTPREKEIKAQSDFAKMGQQMAAQNWDDALATSDELIKLAPKNGEVFYNRACVLARLGILS